MYLAELRYKEAIPELEKPPILSPESAELEISLGQAYHNTGHDKEAIAAFEKGASLSKSPAVWNAVARNLAPTMKRTRAARSISPKPASMRASLCVLATRTHLLPNSIRPASDER